MKNHFFIRISAAFICLMAVIFPVSVSAKSGASPVSGITVSAVKAGGGTFYIGQSEAELLSAAKANGFKIDYNAQSSTYEHDSGGNADFYAAVSGGIVTDIDNFIFPSADGLKIGDSLDTIKKMYEEPYAYEFTDGEMFLYRSGDVYMYIESTNQSGPDTVRPPVVYGIRYLSAGNPILLGFFNIQDDSCPGTPLGNGTALVSYGRYLFCTSPETGTDSPRNLVRINKLTGQEDVLACSVASKLFCDGERIYFTSVDANDNPLYVCGVFVGGNGLDIKKYCVGALAGFNGLNALYALQQGSGGHDTLLKASPYGGEPTVITKDAHSFVCFDAATNSTFYTEYSPKKVSAAIEGTISLHCLDSMTGNDTIIATLPAGKDGSPTYIKNARVVGNFVYYAYGAYQGSGSFWYGDICVSALDGSSTKTLAKNAAEQFFIKGTNMYYTTDAETSNPKNTVLNMTSGKPSPSNQNVYDAYDGKNSVYYFDNSNKDKLILNTRMINTDLSGGKPVVLLDRTPITNITQTLRNISAAGDWVYFEVSNVDYSIPGAAWWGCATPSDYYIVNRDGTGLKKLGSAQAQLTSAVVPEY